MEKQHDSNYLKGIIESILFVSDKPVVMDQLKEVASMLSTAEIKAIIKDLIEEYQNSARGMCVVEIAGGYQMLSNSYYASHVRKFFKTRVKEKLTRPSLETLAIIAYKQPVSRADIELIRGVNSDGVTDHLSGKGLIKIVGRKDVPGRPYLYGTTKLFLEYFGLKALEDLPKLEDFSSLHQIGETDPSGQFLMESNKEQLLEEESASQKEIGQAPAEQISTSDKEVVSPEETPEEVDHKIEQQTEEEAPQVEGEISLPKGDEQFVSGTAKEFSSQGDQPIEETEPQEKKEEPRQEFAVEQAQTLKDAWNEMNKPEGENAKAIEENCNTETGSPAEAKQEMECGSQDNVVKESVSGQ